MFVDRPVVEITAATAVCGYVNVSWTATGNNDECSPVQYNVTLSSSTMDMTVSITSMNTHSFTELSNNTQFNVTVIGINVMGVVSDPASTSVDIRMFCIIIIISTYVRTMFYWLEAVALIVTKLTTLDGCCVAKCADNHKLICTLRM